jgi:SAM-dependent methyltransferase
MPLEEFNHLDDVKETLIYSRFNTEQQCHFLDQLFTKLIRHSNTKQLLDIGCGYGRHALALVNLSYQVTGIDINDSAIKRAISKQTSPDNPLFLHENITNLQSSATFDGAYAHNSVMSYFIDPEHFMATLKNINSLLTANGVFIFDYFFPVNLLRQKQYADNVSRTASIDDMTLHSHSTHSINIDQKIHRAINRYRLTTKEAEKSFQSEDIMRYWLPKEIIAILKTCGFKRTKLLDRETRQRLTSTSNGILVIAGK